MIRILLVEDREADAREVTWTFEDIGIPKDAICWVAESDAALVAAQEYEPDFILMDLNLQGSRLDGIQLTQKLTELNGWDVVVLTTSDRQSDIDAAIAAGAAAYVVKVWGAQGEADLLAVKRVWYDKGYCPKEWVKSFVHIDERFVEP